MALKHPDLPNLTPHNHIETSTPTDTYNCIAWAANDVQSWWWPAGYGYWPTGVTRAETLPAFEEAFATMGYSPCANADLEPGFEKVAIFVNSSRVPTHAARQLATGQWTSKLGEWYDIAHSTLADIAGGKYGVVGSLLRRKP